MESSSSKTETYGGIDDRGKEDQPISSANTLDSASSSSNNDKDGPGSHGEATDYSPTALDDTQYQQAQARFPSPTPSDRLEKEYEQNCLELWDAAYDSLKEDHPALLVRYEEKLTRKAAPAFRWANWSYNDGYLTPNIISQIDPKQRRRQMSQMAAFWLDYFSGDESADWELRDEDLDYWPKLNSKYFFRVEWIARIIRKRKISHCDPQSHIALLASCLATESIYESAELSDQFSQGVVWIISCLKWYNALPKLLLLTGGEFHITDHNENLRNDILELYKAVLLYQIRVVCLHLNSTPNETIAFNIKEPDYKHIVDAQNDLWSFGDYDTYYELFDSFPTCHKDDQRDIEDSCQKEQPKTEEDEETYPLLDELHAVKPYVIKLRSNNDGDTIFASLDRYISSHSEFKSLGTGDDAGPQLLSIKGHPGSGKTFLMFAVVHQLSTKVGQGSLNGIVASYFCGKNYIDSDNLLSILKSLIWQMIRKQPSLIDHLGSVCSILSRENFDHPNDYRAMSTILHGILQEYKDNVYFVVDSIHECAKKDVNKFLDLISTTTKLSPKVKWIISLTETEFWNPVIQSNRKVEFRIDPAHADMQAAIKHYINSKTEEIIGNRKCDNQFLDQLKFQLQKQCRGNFLWVDCACKEITRHDLWDALVVLDRLPIGLQELFFHIKTRLSKMEWENPKYCEDVFLAVTTAFRPLGIDELADLVLFPAQVDLVAILSKCAVFFKLHKATVYFRCQTARNFLGEHMRNSRGHYILARQSLHCLLRWCKNSNSAGPPTNYSAIYWLKHSTTAIQLQTEDDELINLIKDFLENFTRQWTKLLVSTNNITKALDLILDLKKALEVKLNTMSCSYDIFRLIRDVREYLTFHSTHETSLQFGAKTNILFCPSTNGIREKILSSEFPWLHMGPIPAMDLTVKHRISSYINYFRHWEYSSDGQLLVASSSRSVFVLDTDSGEAQCHITYQYQDKIEDVAISCDGLLAVACQDKLDIWNINTGLPERQKLITKEPKVRNVSFSPDGTELAAATGRGVIIWNVPAFEETWWIDYPDITCVVFSPDNKILAAATENKMILRTLNDSGEPRILEASGSSILLPTVAFSPDMAYIATTNLNGEIRIWSLDSGRVLNILDGSTKSRPLVFLPDKLHLASISYGGAIRFWRLPWDQNKCTMKETYKELPGTSISPNGQYVTSGDRIQYLDAIFEEVRVDTRKLNAGQLPRKHEFRVHLIAFSSDGSLLATSDISGAIYLWDGNTGEFRNVLFDGDIEDKAPRFWGLTSLMFSHDGSRLVFTLDDSRIFIVNTFTAKIRVLLGHEEWVKCTGLSQDGQLLVSGSDDRTVRVWDIVNEDGDSFNIEKQDLDKKILRGEDTVDVRGKEQKDKSLAKLEGHDDSVLCVAVSHDARCIASGGDDTTIQLWYISHESGVIKPMNSQCLTGHQGRVVSVAFLSNGVEVISSSEDHTLKIWDISSGSLVRNISTNQEFYALSIDVHYPGFVMTETGLVSIDHSAFGGAGESELPDSCPYRITADRTWVTWKNRELIYLPEQYRPSKGLMTRVYGRKVAIGIKSGQLIFFKFDENAKPFE